MKLNMAERLRLSELLPKEGSRLNLKIVRKLLESLSFSEAELKLIHTETEYACTGFRTAVDGTQTPCGYQGFFSYEPKCELHNESMVATTNWRITDMIPLLDPANEKNVHMGEEAMRLAEIPLKAMDDAGKLTEAYVSLYDKFFPPEEEEADASQGKES